MQISVMRIILADMSKINLRSAKNGMEPSIYANLVHCKGHEEPYDIDQQRLNTDDIDSYIIINPDR